jgi:hypothetical protein
MVSRTSHFFGKIANATSRGAGHASTFIAAILIIVVWGITGPLFSYSDTWQLVINTGTTIITFLMVFLIQNSQNRDSACESARCRNPVLFNQIKYLMRRSAPAPPAETQSATAATPAPRSR